MSCGLSTTSSWFIPRASGIPLTKDNLERHSSLLNNPAGAVNFTRYTAGQLKALRRTSSYRETPILACLIPPREKVLNWLLGTRVAELKALEPNPDRLPYTAYHLGDQRSWEFFLCVTDTMSQAYNSKFSKTDMVKLLSQQEAWSSLTEEQQRRLWRLLPPLDASGVMPSYPVATHPLDTEYREYIRHIIRKFEEDLAEGQTTKAYQREAMEASKERAEGKFDEWKEEEREEYWGQKAVQK